jgi:hypothetical protein
MAVLTDPTTGALGKKVSRSVAADGSALCAVKWAPLEDFDEAGVEISTATVTQAADGLVFTANTVADSGINAYTSAAGAAGEVLYADAAANSVQELLDIINGIEAGQPSALETGYMIRYRAGLGDFRPGFVLGATTGLAVSAANILLGNDPEGLAINGDTSGLETANIYSVGLGTGRGKPGGGQVYADHFESDYATNTSGDRFRVRAQRRRREEQPGLSEFRVALTTVRVDMVYASGAKVVTIYDVDDNVLGVFPIGASVFVPSITEETPFVGPAGSPLFVECVGSGALTDGPMTVTGEVRIA